MILESLVSRFRKVRCLGADKAPRTLRGAGWAGLDKQRLRVLFHYESLYQTQAVQGNIIECGVAAGESLGFFLMLERQLSGERSFWAFDTYEGFPPPSREDGGHLLENPQKLSAYSKYSIDFVKSSLRMRGVQVDHIDNIRFAKGRIPLSLQLYSGEPVSLVNIDLDLYEPTFEALKFFWPLLSVGGRIMLDEYDSDDDLRKWPGAKLAVDEFCEREGVEIIRHYTGRVFLRKS